MNIYIHQGPGHYIGSTIVVVAPDLQKAKWLIRLELDHHGLKDEELKIKEHSVSDQRILLVQDGDY